ncbi:MAG TPA: GGDEF domain-containing protein, partial [Ramlibacter sp.]|nr:GGDEF domain-containing protein [Ramlibacter sp.]
MHAGAIGFVWGAYFGTAALMLAGALAAYAQSHHRVALAAALTALLSALFIGSYLAGLPVADRDLEVRLVALVGLFSATMLQLMLLVDLGFLRDRDRRRRVLTGVVAVAVLTVGVSWLVTPRQALVLGSSLSFAVSVAAMLSALRSAWRGDRQAWAAVSGVLLLPVCVGGVSWIALNPGGVPWQVHAASALAGTMFLVGVGAMLWLRYSYLIELREVLVQGPRYDPITRMQSNGATGHMIAQA